MAHSLAFYKNQNYICPNFAHWEAIHAFILNWKSYNQIHCGPITCLAPVRVWWLPWITLFGISLRPPIGCNITYPVLMVSHTYNCIYRPLPKLIMYLNVPVFSGVWVRIEFLCIKDISLCRSTNTKMIFREILLHGICFLSTILFLYDNTCLSAQNRVKVPENDPKHWKIDLNWGKSLFLHKWHPIIS